MTFTSTAAAIKEIVDPVIDYWGTDNIKLPGKSLDVPADIGSTPFLNVRILHASGVQASFRTPEIGRPYRRLGNVTCELYMPFDNAKEAYEKADDIVSLFQGKRTPGGVWFFDVIQTEVSYRSAYRLDVSANFEYVLTLT